MQMINTGIGGRLFLFFSHQKGAIILGRGLSKVPVTVQTQNAGPFCFDTDGYIMLSAKLLKPLSWM